MNNTKQDIPVDAKVMDTAQLLAVLDHITVQNSVMDFRWKFEIQPIEVRYLGDARFFDATINQVVEATDPTRRGWLLWASFERPDTVTGAVSRGRGRDEVIWQGWSESAVVKTAWVIFQMLVQHEMMEGYRYNDSRIFNPHNTVHELASLQNREVRP